MKRIMLLCFFLSLNLAILSDTLFKRTFFSDIPPFNPTSPELVALNRDRLTYCCDFKKWFDVIIEGGMSLDSWKISNYFSPNTCNSNSILVGELGSESVSNGTADLVANYFNILTDSMFVTGAVADFTNYTFQSKIIFKPKQQFFAAALVYHQHISRTQDKGWWFEFVFPIKWVKNNMHLEEEVITPGGPGGDDPQVPNGYMANMKQAFKQPKFKFGKIDGPQSAGGIADPQLRLGYTYFNHESFHLSSYWGAILPTSNKPTAEYMFEPIYGNNSHFGIFAAASVGARIWRSCERAIYWELDTNGILLLKNKQTRSFDLKDKTWGRYIWVYTDKTVTTTSPGINEFTKEVEVTPGTSRDLNIAFTYECPCFRIEGGYNYYGRQAEMVCLSRPWGEKVALASIINKDGDYQIGKGVGDSAISRDRSTASDYLGVLNDMTVESDDTYKMIRQCDLDLNSAAHPATVSHTFYGVGSYNWGPCDRPKYFGLGIIYSNGSDNSTLNQITIFSKFGMTF
jgi:hypothetical protein